MSGKASSIQVTMFGKFSLQVGPLQLQETGHMHQLDHLLQILLIYRNNTLTNAHIAQLLWEENPPEHPENALKNLVYRLRVQLVKLGIRNGRELIVHTDTGYAWNNRFSCQIDREEFEQAFQEGMENIYDSKLALESFRTVIALYQGEFLPTSKAHAWTETLRARYHEMYLAAATQIIKFHTEQDHHTIIELLAKQVLSIDEYVEKMHYYLISSLIQQGEIAQAVAQFRYTSSVFQHLHQCENENELAFLQDLRQQLLEYVEEEALTLAVSDFDLDRAYFCDYETFKQLYLAEARVSLQLGETMYLVAFYLEIDAKDEKHRRELLSQGMKTLGQVLAHKLQPRDIYARASENHFLAVIKSENSGHCDAVANQLELHFRYRCRRPEIQMRTYIQQLEPNA